MLVGQYTLLDLTHLRKSGMGGALNPRRPRRRCHMDHALTFMINPFALCPLHKSLSLLTADHR